MSSYYLKLQAANPEVAERYRQKLSVINNVDPFALDDSSFSIKLCDFPPLMEIDIVNYLMVTTRFYTPSQMKAHKSLDAYKFFIAGYVNNCGSLIINDSIVLVGKFENSQIMNDPSLKVWIICQKDGSIDSAHCTCMPGPSEVCNHVGAVLYTVEYILKEGKHRCDVESLWNSPTTDISIAPSDEEIECGPLKQLTISNVNNEVPALTPEEIVSLLQKLEDAGCSSVLMTVVEPFCSRIAKEMEARRTNK